MSKRAVRELMGEAGVAGDRAMVALCERALEGDEDAWQACERAIRSAQAMAEPD